MSRECLLARLKFWFTTEQKALSCDSSCRQDCGHYWKTLMVSYQGSEGEKPCLVWSTLWGSLEDCRIRIRANTRVLVTLLCPIPSLLLFVFAKLEESLTKAGITELCQLLCSLSLIFFHPLLNAMKICSSYLLGNYQVSNSSSLRQRLPAKGNWNVAICLYCTTGASHQMSSERTWKKKCW